LTTSPKIFNQLIDSYRYLKSQQEKQAKIADEAATEEAYNGKTITMKIVTNYNYVYTQQM